MNNFYPPQIETKYISRGLEHITWGVSNNINIQFPMTIQGPRGPHPPLSMKMLRLKGPTLFCTLP